MRRDVFQAIADPTRRDIISLIAKNPMTPNEVAKSFDVSRQAISKHMQILTECGVLAIDVQGRERVYTVQPKELVAVAVWAEPFRELWETRFNDLNAVLKKMKSSKKLKTKRHGK